MQINATPIVEVRFGSMQLKTLFVLADDDPPLATAFLDDLLKTFGRCAAMRSRELIGPDRAAQLC